MTRIRTWAAILAALGAAVLAAVLLLRPHRDATPEADREVEAQLRQAVEQLRPFPQRIDEFTLLTDARASGRTMTYVYRLTVAEPFDQAAQRTRLQGAACDNPAMRAAIVEHRVAFTYEYRAFADPDRVEASITVSRCD